MTASEEFLAGAINSDGETALIFHRPLARRPFSATIDPNGRLTTLGETFRLNDAVAHVLREKKKTLCVVMSGEEPVDEFEMVIQVLG